MYSHNKNMLYQLGKVTNAWQPGDMEALSAAEKVILQRGFKQGMYWLNYTNP